MRRRASPVTEISVSSTEISATRMKFSHMNTPGWLPGRKFVDKLASRSKLGGKNGVILPCMHFDFKSIRRLALLVKLQESTEL